MRPRVPMQNRHFIFEGPIEKSMTNPPMFGFRCSCGESAYGELPQDVSIEQNAQVLSECLSEADKDGLEGFLREHEALGHTVKPTLLYGQ